MNGLLVVGGSQKMGELKIGATPIPSPAPSAAAVGQTTEPPKQQFGRIRLDIWNSVLPREKLSPTPSQKDGLSEELEKEIRSLGCDLIQLAGKLLKLPQVAMATACVLFQRFYYAKSLIRLPFDVVAMSCLTLASKIEEAPRRNRDILNVFHHIRQARSGKQIQPMILDANYISLKNQVIKAERRVLKELGFCVHVKHPHKIIVMYLKWLELDQHRELIQMSCGEDRRPSAKVFGLPVSECKRSDPSERAPLFSDDRFKGLEGALPSYHF